MKNSKPKIRLILYGCFSLLWMGFIFYMSSRNAVESTKMSDGMADTFIGRILSVFPSLTGEGLLYDIRKYGHIFEYTVLGIIVTLFFLELEKVKELFKSKAGSKILVYLSSTLVCFLYACSDEFHQLFVPGRSGKFGDVVFDSVGYGIGIVFIFLLKLIVSFKDKDTPNIV